MSGTQNVCKPYKGIFPRLLCHLFSASSLVAPELNPPPQSRSFRLGMIFGAPNGIKMMECVERKGGLFIP